MTASITWRRIVSGISVGQMLTTLGSGETLQTINTVVTSIRYDFRQQSTTLETGHADLDLHLASGRP